MMRPLKHLMSLKTYILTITIRTLMILPGISGDDIQCYDSSQNETYIMLTQCKATTQFATTTSLQPTTVSMETRTHAIPSINTSSANITTLPTESTTKASSAQHMSTKKSRKKRSADDNHVKYCFIIKEKTTKLKFNGDPYDRTYGCVQSETYQNLCDKQKDKLGQFVNVTLDNKKVGLLCCNESKCNKPLPENTTFTTTTTIPPLQCFKVHSPVKRRAPSIDLRKHKDVGPRPVFCDVNEGCFSAFSVTSVPPGDKNNSLIKVAKHSHGCTAKCSRNQRSPSSQHCFLDANTTLCICCCYSNLCNNMSTKPQHCFIPHKPDGSTSKSVVIGVVAAVLVGFVCLVIAVMICRKLRKPKASPVVYNYTRVDASNTDEDTHMLIAS